MSSTRVFTFSPDWGLPTTGPFALKLLAWLQLAGLPYRQEFQDNAGKGPGGKSPWAEIDGETIADSERIIDLLAHRHGFDIDAGLSEGQRADAHAWRRTFEEHFHQVLEWELFMHPNGIAYIDAAIARAAPPVVRNVVAASVRRHFRRQLHARGIARHAPATIAAKGCTDLDMLAIRLAASPYLVGDRPCLADLAVFGQVAPMVAWPMDTPVANRAKTLRPVVSFVDRLRDQCFAELSAAA